MSRARSSDDAKASRQPAPGLLDLLSSGEPPAFANDQNHRIIFWNKGAERLMDRTASQTLGRLCHEVFGGRDPFGNRFCGESCSVTSTLKEHESVNRFELSVGDPSHARSVGMTVVEIPGIETGQFTAVHIMDAFDGNDRLARELSRLRKEGAPPNSAARVPVALEKRRTGSREAKDVDPDVAGQLSERERDVLRLIAEGRANKDVAQALHISLATTRNHVQHILKKLRVHSKLEAVALVFRRG